MVWKGFFKLLFFILCFTFFIFNIKETFHQFQQSKTTLLSNKVAYTKRRFPTLTFCNKNGLKVPANQVDLWKKEDYLRQTYDLEELFDAIGVSTEFVDTTHVKEHNQATTTPTIFRGRCYTFSYPYEMQAAESITFRPKPNVSLVIFGHEPEEEFYISTSWIPEGFSKVILEEDVALMDLQFQTEVLVQEKSCKEGLNNSMFAKCLRNAFKQHYHQKLEQGELPPCQVPWIQKALDDELRTNWTDCSLHEFSQIAKFYNHFMKRGSQANLPECPAPCINIRHKLDFEAYNYHSMGVTALMRSNRSIYAAYPVLEVTEYTHKFATSANDFISALGGSLGLFLGFSCLGLLLQLLDSFSSLLVKIKFM